jgi:hypothetical protein
MWLVERRRRTELFFWLIESSRTFTNTSSSFAPIDSFAPSHSGIRPAHCAALGAGSELVVLVFEQDVERGERSVTARRFAVSRRVR